jgi:uncharacterized protein (DUF1330 family)
MQVINALFASSEKSEAFFDGPEDGPFVMVSLLKFRERAEYADGSEPNLSGVEAFGRYGEAAQPLIAVVGGRPVGGGVITGLLVGEVEDLWDSVGMVEYPSLAAFQSMLTSPEYKAIEHHRKAGLAGQLGFRMKPGSSSR